MVCRTTFELLNLIHPALEPKPLRSDDGDDDVNVMTLMLDDDGWMVDDGWMLDDDGDAGDNDFDG